jgi:hypothetical protein
LNELVTTSATDYDVNAFDGVGNTSLHWAASAGNFQCLLQLIEWGAKLNSKNYMGMTPREYAIHRSRWIIGEAKDRSRARQKRRTIGLTSAGSDDGHGACKINISDVVRCIKTLERAEQAGGANGDVPFSWKRMHKHMKHARANGFTMGGFALELLHVPLPITGPERPKAGSTNQEGGDASPAGLPKKKRSKQKMLLSESAPEGLREGFKNRQCGVTVRPLDEEARIRRRNPPVEGKREALERSLAKSRSYACNLEPLPLAPIQKEHMEGWAKPVALRGGGGSPGAI